MSSAIISNNINMVKYLHRNNINTQSKIDEYMMRYLIINCNIEMIKYIFNHLRYLFEIGIEIDIEIDEVIIKSLIHNNNMKMFRWLDDNGYDFSIYQEDINLAAVYGNMEMIRYFLDEFLGLKLDMDALDDEMKLIFELFY